MTEVQDTTDRRVKWMRYSARALALLWAAWCSLSVAYSSALLAGFFQCIDCPSHEQGPVWGTGLLVPTACLALPIWASAAIGWRWERIAGVVLVLEGLVSITCLWMIPARWVLLTVAIGATPLPALAAGILFLASWWTSRSPSVVASTE
jgi:hypothetical protein